ncbi:MAG: GntR family transcriptional regulator [Phycisphaerales bacterium]|jgi:DNA-binding LacI/PurR family transcriptional regulator|nr:GntR family transcriptional regulator [Phycisphaerales bacterium]
MPVMRQLKQSKAREEVLRRIQNGDYRPGERLPSERVLARDLGMSHIALRKGLMELVEAGVIVRRPRVGAFVQQTRPLELSTRLAIVVPDYMGQGHPFLPLLMGGVLSGLDQHRHEISIFTYKAGTQFWNEAGEKMVARGIHGAIIFTSYIIPLEELQKLERSGIKAVLLNVTTACPRSRISTITVDLSQSMREAMQRLVDLGHRRITWMSYEITAFREYEEQLAAEFSQKYDLHEPSNVIRRLGCEARDYDQWEAILQGENRPTAMILQDEFMAHEVYRVCHQLGLRVPDDLSLVAFADALPRSYVVPLSAPDTVSSWNAAAQRAAEHLHYLLETGEKRTLESTLHASIQWKASTGPAPVESALTTS